MLNIYCERCGKRPKHQDKKWCERCIGIHYRRLSGKFDFSDIPANYLKASFDDFPDMADMPMTMAEDDNLYFCGDVGTGKTHMMWSVIKYARSKLFYSAEVVEFTRLCSEIRKGFNVDSEAEYDIIKRYSEYDLLCIDDLGLSSTVTDFMYQTLYRILDKRINDCLPTIISSNKSIDEIGLLFDTRIASRLYGFKVIKFLGKDRRLKC